MIWISLVFLQGERIAEEIVLSPMNSYDLKLIFDGAGIGYYKLTMLEFSGQHIFVQILDKKLNVISEENIHTKMSVGYFKFENSGTITAKIINPSENQVNLQVEFGNTNSNNMIFPGIVILIGSLMIIIASYLKLKNYRIEQPDENIS